jgi:hypothetical protein
MAPKRTKPKQVILSLPLGNNGVGETRLAKWKRAALIVMHGDPKHFNSWLRMIVDEEAKKVLEAQEKLRLPPPK